MKKKFLSVVLCFALMLSVGGIMFAQISAQGEVPTVYVASNGSDSNDGLTVETPLKTLAAAINTVNTLGLTGENRVVTVTKSDWSDMSFDMSSCETYSEMITLKAIDDGTTVWTKDDMHLAGPLTLDLTYGKSSSKKGLSIYTHGYDFILGENALDKYTDTAIYAGYDKNFESTDKDSCGIINFDKNINVTLETQKEFNVSLYIGNYKYNDIGIVQYKDVNLVIDSPNITVPLLMIGNNGNYNVGISDRMNRFEDFSVTLKSVAEITSIMGYTYYNGSLINNLQFIYNNAMFDKITDNIVYGDYGDTAITYMNKWVLKEENDAVDSALVATNNIGEFKTEGINVAVATDSNSKQYKSADGKLNLPAGEYTITYESAGDYHYANGVLTAIKDLENIDITDIAPIQDGDMILNGWQTEEGEYLSDTANVSLSANQKLYAVYSKFDITNDDDTTDFYVSHTEYRADSDVGLRFLINKGDNFNSALKEFSDIKYGYLVLPKHYVDIGETLTIDNSNAAKGVCDRGFFYWLRDKKSYTACVTDIKDNHYDELYNACGYVTYVDLNGNSRTAYSNTISCSLLETAANVAYNSDELTPEKKEEALNIINSGLTSAKTKLKNEVDTVADTVESNATGNIYYVSENGSDSNDGLSKDTPWKTLKKVNETTFSSGDAVLFERGGTYRSYFKESIKAWKEHSSVDLQSGVSYGAYGTGEKPVINGSNMNFAETTWYGYSGKENVYYAKLYCYIDPAVLRVTTNDNYSYDGAVQASITDLDKDWEFYYDRNDTGYIYLYCPYGNPSNLLKDIEIGFGVSMFRLNSISDVIIENISFKYIGRHAVASTKESSNITVRGCEFEYIGGCLSDPKGDPATELRLGNAIEFLNGGKNVLIENCSFDNIFDSGVTFQGGSSDICEIESFIVRNSVFNKCGLGSFEYWLGALGTAKNILLENNYMENAGMGIGGVDVRLSGSKDKNGHIRSDGVNRMINFVVRNNYFDNSADNAYLLVLICNKADGGIVPTFYNNAYIQGVDKKLMLVADESGSIQYVFETDAGNTLKNIVDDRPIVIYK